MKALGGQVHGSPSDSLDTRCHTHIICSECISGKGGAATIMKWSIPHYFPEFGFTEMKEHLERGDNTTTFTAKADDGEVWMFDFRATRYAPRDEFSIVLEFARSAYNTWDAE